MKSRKKPMKKSRRGFLATAAGATLATGTVAGQNDTAENTTNTTNQTSTNQQDRPPKTHVVEMRSGGGAYFFDPIGLFVLPGDTVRWVVVEPPHSSTAYEAGNGPAEATLIPEGAEAWNSGTLTGEGDSFEYTFEVEGTYDYFCIPHKTLGMVGRIVCGEPGGPAEQKEIPDPMPGEAQGEGTVPPSQAIVNQQKIPYPYTQQQEGGGGEGAGARSLEEIGVPYQAHFVGVGALSAVGISLLYTFYFLKYADSPQHQDQRDR